MDLSPWQAPAVFGKDAFGGGASDTLSAMLPLCEDKAKTYYIGGYSLAGLFALWAAYQTDTFKGVAAVSPSVWFPDFENYVFQNRIQTELLCRTSSRLQYHTPTCSLAILQSYSCKIEKVVINNRLILSRFYFCSNSCFRNIKNQY